MAKTVVNLAGALFFFLSFAVAYGLRATVLPRLSHLMVLAVALGLCVFADLAWRWTRGNRKWFAAANGGTFCLLPLWVFGLIWMAKAGYEAFYGPITGVSLAGPR